MRFKVSLKKDGKEFDEVVIANNKNDAIEVALRNNPEAEVLNSCLLYTSPSPRDRTRSRMPSSA